jgi:predicted metal-dependent phosphotriesterase family hydrolase
VNELYIQTVDGPVAPDELGITPTHEHVFLELWADDGQGYVGQLRDEDVLAAELGRFRDAGGSCVVDQTPGGAGRDAAGLRRLSARTGLKIVTGCGWYTEPFYPPAHDLARRSTAAIAEELVSEIRDGFGDTGVRPGIIGEIGAGQGWISPLEERVPRAAARAQMKTGLPLATHTLYHAAGAAQMALFDEESVDPGRVCIGHCDTFPSLEYCLSVARWGGYVSTTTSAFSWVSTKPRSAPSSSASSTRATRRRSFCPRMSVRRPNCGRAAAVGTPRRNAGASASATARPYR